MAYDEGFQAIVRAAAKEVALRSQAAYWLLAEKNKDLVSILADMRPAKREKWIQEQVLKSYEEAKWYVNYLYPRVQYATEQLRVAVEKGDRNKTNQYKNNLVELGESMLYWDGLLNTCRDIFDAVWRLGTTLPVPDFEEPREDEGFGPRSFLTMMRSRGGPLHRGTKATVSQMELQAEAERKALPPISEALPAERPRDARRRPLDEVLEAEKKKKELEDEDDDVDIRGF